MSNDLVRLHRCGWNRGTYPKAEPVWVNPTHVVAVWGERHMLHGYEREYSKVRLIGDASSQDWSLIWESPSEVLVALAAHNAGPKQTVAPGHNGGSEP